MPESSRDAGGLSFHQPFLHTVYTYLTVLLLTLVAIKYQNSATNPFNEQQSIMLFFLIAIFVYAITLIKMSYQSFDDDISRFHVCICHVSGALACELLLLILVTPICWAVINISSAILVVTLCFCYQYALLAFSLVRTSCQTSITATVGDEQPDLEMGAAQAAP